MGRGGHSIQVLAPVVARGGPAEEQASPPPELPELRPRGVGAQLDMAFDALRARAPTCLLLAVPLWLPVHGFERWLLATGAVELGQVGDFGFLFAQGAVASAVRALTIALVTLVVYGYVQGARPSALAALGACLARAPALFVLTLVTGLCMFAATTCGALCLFAPAVLLGWLWGAAPAALVLEGVGPIQALRRSAALARTGFPRWVGIALVGKALVLPFVGAIQVLALPAGREALRAALGLSEPWFTGLDLLLCSLLSGGAAALAAVALTVYYIDQRVRVEGFDLDMRLERLRARAVPGRGR